MRRKDPGLLQQGGRTCRRAALPETACDGTLVQAVPPVTAGDKLMLLSTCDTNARYKRDVLLVKLEEAR